MIGLDPILRDYLPLAVAVGIAAGFALFAIALSGRLAPKRIREQKRVPYECGIVPSGDARGRFPVKFYLVAMVFILFDVEAVFLYPWGVAYRDLAAELGPWALVEMLAFLGVLFLGLLYLWRKGALEWR